MINLPSKYDINAPENQGWLALYLAIVKKMSGEKAIKAMGMQVQIDVNKSKRKQGEVIEQSTNKSSASDERATETH